MKKYSVKHWSCHGNQHESAFGQVRRVNNAWLAMLKVYTSETPNKVETYRTTYIPIKQCKSASEARRVVEQAADQYADYLVGEQEKHTMLLIPKPRMRQKILKHDKYLQAIKDYKPSDAEHKHEHICGEPCAHNHDTPAV